MNLDELQSVRDRERQTDKLQPLRESFYEEAGKFVHQLRTERDRAAERVDDPFDAPEVSQLSDEIHTAEQTVEAIYEKRVGKIVKAASFAAADLPAESDGMTAEERDLFDGLVSDIKTNRQRVLRVLGGQSDSGTETREENDRSPEPETRSDTSGTSGSISAADVMGGTGSDESKPSREPTESDGENDTPSGRDTEETTGSDESVPTAGEETRIDSVRRDGGTDRSQGTMGGIERETVRITDDVGTFVGYDDREYELEADDVVTLPTTNVDPLVQKNVAEKLD